MDQRFIDKIKNKKFNNKIELLKSFELATQSPKTIDDFKTIKQLSQIVVKYLSNNNDHKDDIDS